jgi:hypothetical protein
MRVLPYVVLASGLAVITVVFASPAIVEWQAHNLLTRFGAEDLVEQVVQQRLADTYLNRVIGFGLACFAILGGLLVIRDHKSGPKLVMIVSVGFVCLALASLLWGAASFNVVGPVLGIVWWSSIGIAAARRRKSAGQLPSNKTMEPTLWRFCLASSRRAAHRRRSAGR